MAIWFLEGFFGSRTNTLQRIALKDFPILVGRDEELALSLPSSDVSRRHAELMLRDNQLALHDLGSTNGTFVNRQRVNTEILLSHGDVIHFANVEVRLINDVIEASGINPDHTTLNLGPLAQRLPTGLSALQNILNLRDIRAQFQPIVSITGELFGYEVLGRGRRQDLPFRPLELFRIAESMEGKAGELSTLMRDMGVAQAIEKMPRLPQATRLFVNTHPEELGKLESLASSLQQLREQFPHIPLVLEIHENGITDQVSMGAFTKLLAKLNIELAFDDFGAGQSRLMELADIRVNYVKFDISLIRGLHQAPAHKQLLVASLCELSQSMGALALAEGIESAAELAVCRDMKFDLLQGYHIGRPADDLDYQPRIA